MRPCIQAMCLVSIGTSLPDIFTSVAAARSTRSTEADAALGSFAAGNAANVFLGLGIPWTIVTIYEWTVNDGNYYIGRQETGDLTWALVMFMSAAIVCFCVLLIRRYKCNGELGGEDSEDPNKEDGAVQNN